MCVCVCVIEIKRSYFFEEKNWGRKKNNLTCGVLVLPHRKPPQKQPGVAHAESLRRLLDGETTSRDPLGWSP